MQKKWLNLKNIHSSDRKSGMSKFIRAISIGVLAGVIDVVPMVLQKIDMYANASAFTHWVVMGIILSYLRTPLASWLQGLLIGELSVVPFILIVVKDSPGSVLPMVVMSAILGTLVGILSGKFVRP